MEKQHFSKILIPAFYLAAMALVMFSAWNEQKTVREGGSSPLYQNLMEKPAYIRQGFDPAEIRIIPQEIQIPVNNGVWTGFTSTPLRVKNSLLPDLPKRPFLSPKKIDAQEYTIIIPVSLDDTAMSFLDANPALIPGIFLAYIGENWEIFFNGVSVLSEIHLKESGQINERRTWRSVYFPIDRTFIVPGTNILALRIIGDPTHLMTGLSYNAPHYMDDYQLIEQRQNKLPLILLCGIFGFTGVYYLAIFLSLRKKDEIFNLYFGIYSILICMFVATRHGLLRHLIPNSEITLSMEFGSLMMMMPLFFMFIENLGRGRVTKPTWVFLAVSLYFTLTQMFFPAQYREDVIVVFNIYTILIHYPYVIIYDIIYFYLFDKKRIRTSDDVSSTLIINIIVGTLAVFFCAAFDILDVLFFHLSYSLFPFSNFVVHIGMTFALAGRFSGMYKQLEQSHSGLETAVRERTLELEEQTRIAVKASRAKSEFLATMSHEIRTPLNTVIGLSEIELRERLPDSSRENIAQIQQSGSTLLGIIGDILDISKIEAGSFELSPVTYETASLLNDTVNLNVVRIDSKPINFVTEIGGDFPARLVGDDLRVKQMLNNLLSNAIKYTEEGTITLNIAWEKIPIPNSPFLIPHSPALLRFSVRDTGIGIRTEDMGKLFENYTQIETEADRRIEGTGLGLAITKQIVQMMGGSITVESEYNKGSCFTAEIIQGLVDDTVIG
ncbi:MAG: histidine kinase, partial [Treponema sp.]|nr:histidine kinase [Treponema sp.]